MLRHEMETARAGMFASSLRNGALLYRLLRLVCRSCVLVVRVADTRKPNIRFEGEDGEVEAFPDEVRQGSRASAWAAAVRRLAQDAHRVEAISVRARPPSNGTVRQDGEHLCRNVQLHTRPEDRGELLATTLCAAFHDDNVQARPGQGESSS